MFNFAYLVTKLDKHKQQEEGLTFSDYKKYKFSLIFSK